MLPSFLRKAFALLAAAAACLAVADAQPTLNGPGYSGIAAELGQTVVFSGFSAFGTPPLTYQWGLVSGSGAFAPLSDGPTGHGSTASGSATNVLTLTGAAPADAGNYSLQVTDANGYSRISSSIALSLKSAAAPIITSSPAAATTVAGQNVSFSVTATGSYPRTYQWYKGAPPNGTAIGGASASPFTLASPVAGDAGSYYVVVGNAYGSATSGAAALTVTPANPIIFSTINSQTITVIQGQQLSLYVSLSQGSSPIAYQWSKNGQAITGATSSSYLVASAATSDAGSYTLTATNAAGGATSAAITVTVQPATPPVITSQPQSQAVAQGTSTSFYVSATGTNPFTYQWFKNGAAIASGQGSSFYLSNVATTDAGSYSVSLTNAAGSVTSSAAILTVTPPLPPSFYVFSPNTVTATLGGTLSLSAPSINGGSGPFTYQWYKNGALVPGATAASLTITNAQASDMGNYSVLVTNSGGSTASPAITAVVTPPANIGTMWLDAAQQGSILYFLFPLHIERYNLATGSWLASTTTTQAATAFCVAADGIYVGFGRAVAKLPLDLSSQTTFANLGGSVVGMFSSGNYVFAAVSGGETYPIDRNTGAVGSGSGAFDGSSTSMAFAVAPTGGKVFTPNTIWGPGFATVGAGGALTSVGGTTTYYGTFPNSTRAFVLPDQTHFADDAGTIFKIADLTPAGAFGGPITDVTGLPDGSLAVLRSGVLYRYGTPADRAGIAELAHAYLSVQGVRIFSQGSNVLVFYPVTGTGSAGIGLQTVAASAISSGYSTAAAVASPGAVAYTADQMAQDNNGVVYILSSSLQNVIRYSPSAQAYLPSIALTGSPTNLAVSSTLNRLYLSYASGKVTMVDLSAAHPTEAPFAAFPDSVSALTAADNYLFAILQEGSSSAQVEAVMDPNGVISGFSSWSYFASAYRWSPALQALFGQGSQFAGVVTLTSAGGIGSGGAVSSAQYFPAPDGSRLIDASGKVYNSGYAALGLIANTITDATFIGSAPVTLRTNAGQAEVQSWSPTNFFLTETIDLPGTPVRILPAPGNQVILVTKNGSATAFTLLNAQLQRVTPGAGSGTPTLVGSPASSVAAVQGSPLDLGVDATGAGTLSYQWARNGTAIGGATNPTLHIDSVAAADAGSYTVTVTGSTGTITSPATTVNVYSALAFATQPASAITTYGGSATFTATVANNTGVSYQWYQNGTPVSGATSATLVVNQVYQNANYVLKISNGGGSRFSNPVSLVYSNSSAPAFSTAPQAQSVQLGNPVTFTAAATGSINSNSDAVSYQWYLNGNAIPGATSATYSLAAATAADAGAYAVGAMNSYGTTYTSSATLTVNPSGYSGAYFGSTSDGGSWALFVATNNRGYWIEVSPLGSIEGTVAIASNGRLQPLKLTSFANATAGSAAMPTTLFATITNGALTGTVSNGSKNIALQGSNYDHGGFPNSGSYTAAELNGGAGTLYLVVGPSGQVMGVLTSVSASGTFADYVGGHLDANDRFTFTTLGGAAVSGVVDAGGASLTGSVTAGEVTSALGGLASGVPNTAHLVNLSSRAEVGTGADILAAGFSVAGNTGKAILLRGVGPALNAFGISPSLESPMLTLYDNTGATVASGTAWGGAANLSALFSRLGAFALDAGSADSALVVAEPGGVYSAQVSGQGGATGVALAEVYDADGQPGSRLVNLSARAQVGTGNNILVAGLVIGGSGPETVLLRGVGPALGTFGLDGVLPAVQLTLFDGASHQIAANSGWGQSATPLSAIFAQVGAFPLPANSADAALLVTLMPGSYSVQVSGQNGATGIALVEVYEVPAQ